MNIEEARRAAIRREEDQLWVRLRQQAERSHGETIRRQQRAKQQRKEEHGKELQKAQYEYAVAQSEQNRAAEEGTRLRETEERTRLDEQRRLALKRDQQRKFKEKQKKAEDENAILETEMKRESELKSKRDVDRKQRAKAAIKDHLARTQGAESSLRVAKGANGGASTPQPGSQLYSMGDDSISPERRSHTSMGTKNSSHHRTRNIDNEEEVGYLKKEEQKKERQLREIKHLENLLGRRRKEEEERQYKADAEAKAEADATRKESRLAEEAIAAKHRHFDHLERNREAQLEDRRKMKELAKIEETQFPDVDSPSRGFAISRSGSGEDTAHRMQTEVKHRNENDALHRSRLERKRKEDEKNHKLSQKAREKQMKRQEAENRKREDQSRMLTEKARYNLDHVRAIRKAEIEKLDQNMYLDMEAAKKVKYAEDREMANFAVALKENEKQRAEFSKWKADQRSINIQKNAVQARMEMLEMRESMAQRANERREVDTALADELARNRRHAVERMRLNALKQKEQEAVLQSKQRQQRIEANEAFEAERAKRLEEKAYQQTVKKRDTQLNRAKLNAIKHAEIERNAAFYDSQAPAKKDGVPRTKKPNPSDQVVLPPHPEMRGLEQDTNAFMKSLSADLAAADAWNRRLPKRI